jgi:phosphatidyl-myo-inositol dimannoside synthase
VGLDSEDRRPALLFVAPYFPPAYYGGVVQVYLGLLERLTGYNITVLTDRHNSDAEQQCVWDTALKRRHAIAVRRMHAFELHFAWERHGGRPTSHLTPLLRVMDLVAFLRRGRREWKQLLSELRPDLVVCGGSYSVGWLTQDLPASVPLINYLHGEELTMQMRPRLLMPHMRRWQMRSIRTADRNVAVSSYTARLAQSLAGADAERVEVLPNFVDTGRFRISGRRGELRARLGWEGRLVILTLARLEPRKGIDQALRALALLERERKLPAEWMYVIAGRGRELEALKGLSGELGLSDRVVFRGFVPDGEVPDLYEAADVFLQPNREIDGDTEGFGIVFLEASACGLPVIGGVAGGTADAIEEGVSGYRVDGESVEAIAGALGRLCGDAGLRAQMGEQGSARVAAYFTVEQAAARFQRLLDDVLVRRKGVP